jgi:hypothetical protein
MAILEKPTRARVQPGDILLAAVLGFILIWGGVHGMLWWGLPLLGVVMLVASRRG